MFADDLAPFAEALAEQARVMKECLVPFCSASGQKINHEKSRIIFSTNVNQTEVERISATIDILVTDDLGKYLGVPTLSKRVTKGMFQYIVDRVDKRLMGWRTKCLSLAGCAALFKSTLTAIPAYAM